MRSDVRRLALAACLLCGLVGCGRSSGKGAAEPAGEAVPATADGAAVELLVYYQYFFAPYVAGERDKEGSWISRVPDHNPVRDRLEYEMEGVLSSKGDNSQFSGKAPAPTCFVATLDGRTSTAKEPGQAADSKTYGERIVEQFKAEWQESGNDTILIWDFRHNPADHNLHDVQATHFGLGITVDGRVVFQRKKGDPASILWWRGAKPYPFTQQMKERAAAVLKRFEEQHPQEEKRS